MAPGLEHRPCVLDPRAWTSNRRHFRIGRCARAAQRRCDLRWKQGRRVDQRPAVAVRGSGAILARRGRRRPLGARRSSRGAKRGILWRLPRLGSCARRSLDARGSRRIRQRRRWVRERRSRWIDARARCSRGFVGGACLLHGQIADRLCELQTGVGIGPPRTRRASICSGARCGMRWPLASLGMGAIHRARQRRHRHRRRPGQVREPGCRRMAGELGRRRQRREPRRRRQRRGSLGKRRRTGRARQRRRRGRKRRRRRRPERRCGCARGCARRLDDAEANEHVVVRAFDEALQQRAMLALHQLSDLCVSSELVGQRRERLGVGRPFVRDDRAFQEDVRGQLAPNQPAVLRLNVKDTIPVADIVVKPRNHRRGGDPRDSLCGVFSCCQSGGAM